MNAEPLSEPRAEGAADVEDERVGASNAKTTVAKPPALNFFTNRAIYYFAVNAAAGLYTFSFTLLWGEHVAAGTQFTVSTWLELPFIAFFVALIVSLVLRLIWRSYLRFKEEWWLGEVAKRVQGLYDVDWALISQATRYRPLPKWSQSELFDKNGWRFELSNKSEWLERNAEPTFVIVVPRKGGEIVAMHRPSTKDPWQSAALKSDPDSETVK